eukprot:747680-Hanusia_phi.AAC.2
MRCARSASLRMSGGDATMKPVNMKPSKHDLATGRDPTRVKVENATMFELDGVERSSAGV